METTEQEERKRIIAELSTHWSNDCERKPGYFCYSNLLGIYNAVNEKRMENENYEVTKSSCFDGVIECSLQIDNVNIKLPSLFMVNECIIKSCNKIKDK